MMKPIPYGFVVKASRVRGQSSPMRCVRPLLVCEEIGKNVEHDSK
jgi:hypothetical protein